MQADPPVVAKCVALLKRYLFRYIPRIPTLQQIDMFCVNLIAECNAVANKKASPWVQSANNQRSSSNISVNSSSPSSTSVAFASGALVKSLNYVCALVARHIPKHSFQSALFLGNSHAPSKRFSPTLSSLRSRSFSSQLSPGGIISRGSPENKEAAKSAVMNILGLETIDEEDLNYIAVDVLKLRWIGGKRQQSWTPSPVMTDSGGIARPQVDHKYDFLEHGAASLLLKGAEQKQKVQQEKNVDRRLSSEVHIEQLLQPSTVTTVTDTASARSHLRAIAASKRIKTGSYQGMLSSPPLTARTRAFDLVLNLGIHAHLLEPMLSEDQSVVAEEPSSQSAHFADGEQFFTSAKGDLKSYEKIESGTPRAVGEFEMWLLSILYEIMLFLVQYARANAVEAKANLFGVLFDYVLHELNNKAVSSGNPLPSYDEIQAVATVLVLADAPEAFAVAFKQGLHGIGEELTKSILTAMSRDVSSGRLNAVLLEDMAGSLDAVVAMYTHLDEEFSEMLNMTIVNEDLIHIHKGLLEQETAVDLNSVSQARTTLHSLLHSPRAIYRQNGYFWLIELLFAEMVGGSSIKSNRLNIQNLQEQLRLLGSSENSDTDLLDDQSALLVSSSVRLLCGMLKSKHSYIRWGFLFVLERLLLRCQQLLLDDNELNRSADREFGQDGSKISYAQVKANAVIGLMNGALSQIFLANETDRINILKMCDLLFSQLCLRISPLVAPSIPSNSYIRDDTVFDSLSKSTVGSDKLDSLLFHTEQGGRHYGDDRHINRFGYGSGLVPTDCKSTSMAALLLRGYAAAPRQLVACVPTTLLYL